MGEQQLPEVLVHRLFLPRLGDLYPAVAQGQAHQLRAVLPPGHQGHQGGPGLHDGMPRLGRQAVAVPVGACAGVRGPAASQDHRRGAVLPPGGLHPLDTAVFHQHPDRRLLHQGRPVPSGEPGQGVGDVVGAVRLGEHPPPPLGFQGHAQLLKKPHGGFRREGGKGPIQKFPAPGAGGYRLLHRAAVGHVTAALPGDAHLPAQLPVFLQQGGAPAPGGTGPSGHHAGGPAPHHDHIVLSQNAQLFFSSTFS